MPLEYETWVQRIKELQFVMMDTWYPKINLNLPTNQPTNQPFSASETIIEIWVNLIASTVPASDF